MEEGMMKRKMRRRRMRNRKRRKIRMRKTRRKEEGKQGQRERRCVSKHSRVQPPLLVSHSLISERRKGDHCAMSISTADPYIVIRIHSSQYQTTLMVYSSIFLADRTKNNIISKLSASIPDGLLGPAEYNAYLGALTNCLTQDSCNHAACRAFFATQLQRQ